MKRKRPTKIQKVEKALSNIIKELIEAQESARRHEELERERIAKEDRRNEREGSREESTVAGSDDPNDDIDVTLHGSSILSPTCTLPNGRTGKHATNAPVRCSSKPMASRSKPTSSIASSNVITQETSDVESNYTEWSDSHPSESDDAVSLLARQLTASVRQERE